MTRTGVLIILLASSALAAQPSGSIITVQKKSPRSSTNNRREVMLRKRLEKGYTSLSKLYEPVILAYNNLKKAPPAEYPFYQNELKVTILKEMAENNFGYKSSFTRFAYNLFLPVREYDRNTENSIREFRHHIAPYNISSLRTMIKGVADKELTDKATALKNAIEDITRILTY